MGNKTENFIGLLIAFILCIINVIGYLFYILWQKYRTYFDLIFSIIGLLLCVLELIFTAITMFSVCVHEKSC